MPWIHISVVDPEIYCNRIQLFLSLHQTGSRAMGPVYFIRSRVVLVSNPDPSIVKLLDTQHFSLPPCKFNSVGNDFGKMLHFVRLNNRFITTGLFRSDRTASFFDWLDYLKRHVDRRKRSNLELNLTQCRTHDV